jgi:hypothetical protein
MRASIVAVLLVLAVLAVVAMRFLGDGASETASPPGSTGPGSSQPAHVASTAAGGLPPGTTATRADATPVAAGDVADRPTACLSIADHATGQPIAGAIVRRVQDGAEVAFSDERGLAPVPLAKPAQLAVIVDGYLLRLVPTQLGSTAEEPQRVRMVHDDWSRRHRFDFVAGDGSPIDEAFVRLRPVVGDAPARSPTPAGDAVLQRAWDEHTMLVALPASADVPVQLGRYNADRVHRLANGAVVRFVAAGEFAVEAATTTGLVGRATVRIASAPGVPVLRVTLGGGASVRGRVVAAGSADGLLDAELTVQGGEPLGLVATTADDGGFAIGPLLPGPVTLLVRHPTHAPLAHGAVTAPVDGVVIGLQPLATATLRGRVRSRPDGTPLGGATVVWQAPGGGTT